MTDFITTAFVQDYKTTVMMLTQQMGSRLRGLVSTDSYIGKAGKAVEQFGPTKMVKRLSRHSDTPVIDVPQNARWVFPSDYEWADLVDDQDKLRMAIDPTSPIAKAGAMAAGRTMDDVLLGAFYSNALTGQNGTTSTPFDNTNQVVGVNTGGTTSGLNVAKLRGAKKILMANDVDLEQEQVFCAITATDHDALLNEVQIINTDYNDRPVLVAGKVQEFLGINFKHIEFTNSAAFDNSTQMVNGSSQRLLPVWTQLGMHLGIWEDTMARMDVRPDKGYAWQVYLRETIGATRIDEKRVVQMVCA